MKHVERFTKNKHFLFLIALCLVAMPLAGCLEDPGTETGQNAGDAPNGTGSNEDTASSGTDGSDELSSAWATGTLTTYIKDAPTDHFSEIWVTIEEVRVHRAPGSASSGGNDTTDNETANADGNETENSDGNETENGGGNETFNGGGNETSNGNETSTGDGNVTSNGGGNGDGSGPGQQGNGGWFIATNTTRSVNLMNFSHEGSKAFLGESELPAGRYTQIRLELSDAWGIRAEDGARENITVTTGTAMIVRSFQIHPDETTQLVIDVDLDRSVRAQGPPHNPHGWRMIPVIGKALVTEGMEDDPRQDDPDG